MSRSPKWIRDELIILVDIYLNHDGKKIQKNDQLIIKTSEILNQLPVHRNKEEFEKFRNPNGVYMKLQNLKSFDDSYDGDGLKGGSKLDEEVYKEFENRKEDVKRLSNKIQRLVENQEIHRNLKGVEIEDEVEVKEGRTLYKFHRFRERNRKIIDKKKKHFKERNGRVFCEICSFDFEEEYGELGKGFIECHHITPLSELDDQKETTLNDLILLCSNCHRMVHREPNLSVENLKELINR